MAAPPLHLLTQVADPSAEGGEENVDSNIDRVVDTDSSHEEADEPETPSEQRKGDRKEPAAAGVVAAGGDDRRFLGISIKGLVSSLETLRSTLFRPLQPPDAPGRTRGSRAGQMIWQFQGSFAETAHMSPARHGRAEHPPPSPMSAPSLSPRERSISDVGGEPAERPPLLPPKQEGDPKCTLVLDLDETLVHSSFVPLKDVAHIVVEIEVDGCRHKVYVAERPGLHDFLKEAGELFEIVVFTASMSKYADPVIDAIDRSKSVRHRLYRASCTCTMGSFVKDLSMLGRNVRQCIVVDNSPAAYRLQRQNAVPVTSWFSSTEDHELKDMMEYLRGMADADDVTPALKKLRRRLYRVPLLSRVMNR
mmetsp:Transcript_19421/g.48683  ORF Transcript_19421/g.48683 Transcript_19421/m.48683 type:complete len:363 (-) Transcript_19421:11-1099(-)|eukprot:CAMPEP_0173427366 /NCGR_PEP_ID=MMETSP1357-20121228/6579_1 /TAXON_ID=77926 /ORGANISM="Hemiselmis rufescens, Strain PCC563" /LENGTH=362 /DNA_ID=CAMNT_0014391195 /DNA_START=193 /DNA_END=1281 /DNA_ORIENTATION=+